ncbi:hypothetical protein MNBD_ALPHA06-201 [hydrothermal vent metagenome]|uniref:Flippase-like domain-containing protein n=1 Tax=hydrothermal vent metagenome TaxID=652676 RepID=A0A3B0RSJ3_9ZZZZ
MSKRILRSVLPLGVSLLLVYLLFQSLDFDQIRDTFLNIKLPYLILASLAMVIYFLSGAIRFSLLLSPRINLSLPDSIRLNFSLLLMTYALGPLSEGIRVIYLTRKFSVHWKTAIAAHFSDRLLSIWILFLMLVLLAPFAFRSQISFIILTVIFLGLGLSYLISRTRFWPSWINETLVFFHSSLSSKRGFLLQSMFGIFGMIGSATAIWLLSLSLGLTLNYSVALALAPITILASVIPFTYSGLGSREAILAFFLPMVSSVTKEQAVVLSLAVGLCYFLACLPFIVSIPKLIKDNAAANTQGNHKPAIK